MAWWKEFIREFAANGLALVFVGAAVASFVDGCRRTAALAPGEPTASASGEAAFPIHNPATREYQLHSATFTPGDFPERLDSPPGGATYDTIYFRTAHNRGDRYSRRLDDLRLPAGCDVLLSVRIVGSRAGRPANPRRADAPLCRPLERRARNRLRAGLRPVHCPLTALRGTNGERAGLRCGANRSTQTPAEAAGYRRTSPRADRRGRRSGRCSAAVASTLSSTSLGEPVLSTAA